MREQDFNDESNMSELNFNDGLNMRELNPIDFLSPDAREIVKTKTNFLFNRDHKRHEKSNIETDNKSDTLISHIIVNVFQLIIYERTFQ